MSGRSGYDLLLRGGRVICPASGIDGIFDVAVRDGRIAAVEPSILSSSATQTVDVSGKLVLPGLIDTHGHVYQYVTGRFGLNADMVGVRSGVTTVVDQGGPSCMTLPGFRHFVAEKAETRVYAFLSAYLVGGLEGHFYPNLYSPAGVDIDATVASANDNKDIVRGIKGHAEIRLRPLGHPRHGDGGGDRPADRSPALCPFRYAVEPAGQRRQRRGRGHHSRTRRSALETRRRPGASVHPPPRRLREPEGRSSQSHSCGARQGIEGGCRPRQPFLLSAGAQGARGRRGPAHARRRHARLQH